MQLNADSISIIDTTRRAFEDTFKTNLVNDCYRNVVTAAIPLKAGEKEKINNPEFKEKFSAILSGVSRELVNSFGKVGQFDTGNLLTSMVSSVSDSVSLEADYRQQDIVNNILLGRIPQTRQAVSEACDKAFSNTKSFESEDILKRFKQDLKYVMSVEGANDVIERIKNDVKDAIDETESKNELVEGTTQEIIDYKNEVAPPDDEYQDPNNPNAANADPNDPNAQEDPNADIAGAGDDDLGGNNDSGLSPEGDPYSDGDQIYDNGNGGDDGLGSDPTTTGDDAADQTNPEADPTIGGSDNIVDSGDVGKDNGLGGQIDQSDVGENDSDVTGNQDAIGDDGSAEAGMDDNNLGDVNTDDADPNAAGAADPNMDVGMDPSAGDSGPSNGTSNTDGNSNNNSGGITININGADLKAAKESLNLLNAISLSEKRIPLHPNTFNTMRIPSVETLSAECVNAVGDVQKEMRERLDGLKLAIRQLNTSKESIDALTDKANDYGKKIGEALSNASTYNRTMFELGISPQGIIRSNEHTLSIAREIIDRFLCKKKFVSPTVRPYNSVENVFANAFDIVQLRQHIEHQKRPNTEMVNDLISRENVFYHNMVNFNDDTVKKEATAIIDLGKLNFQKAMSPNFITDYRIKVWEENVGENANKDTNAKVIERVKERFKKLWGRDLNENELSIVKATTNQDDVTEIVPTPYEKFLITMSKESLMANGSEDHSRKLSFTVEQKKDIEWKSRLMTTVYKSCEAFGLLKPQDISAFNKFNTMVGM